MDQGHSQQADYIQKLYAYKQKQQLRDGGNNIKTDSNDNPTGLCNEFLIKAKQKFLDAISVASNQALYQMHLGICYFMENKYNDALQRFEHAVSLKPNFAEAKYV